MVRRHHNNTALRSTQRDKRADEVAVIARRVIPPESERQFQAAVVGLAAMFGWASYYTHDSRHSPAGWPDLFLIRPPRALAAELKTEKGKVSADQAICLALLAGCGVETYVFRPSDKQRITEILR